MDYAKRLMLLSSSEKKPKTSKAVKNIVLKKSKDNKERVSAALKVSASVLKELSDHLHSAYKLIDDNKTSLDDKLLVADFFSCKYGSEMHDEINALKNLANDCSGMLGTMHEIAVTSRAVTLPEEKIGIN